jgi:antitoxin ParD1/3/4
MPSVAKRTFSLPHEQADYIDSLVASGNYASSSEVIRAGLRALQERDAAVDRWLRDEVVPVATAMQADPSRAIAAETVFGEIRALHRRRVKSSGRDS